jgi:F0F1-type ATP synthase assembly protein I
MVIKILFVILLIVLAIIGLNSIEIIPFNFGG